MQLHYGDICWNSDIGNVKEAAHESDRLLSDAEINFYNMELLSFSNDMWSDKSERVGSIV